jgi:aspartate aminotransferase-like enzyme
LPPRAVLQEGLDSTLDEYRRIYANLPQFLENAGLQVLAAHPSLASLAVKYLPQSK